MTAIIQYSSYQILEEFNSVSYTSVILRHKLTHAYGLSVMLPEAIIRLIMFKKKLTYPKAKELYIADVSKVRFPNILEHKESVYCIVLFDV